MPHIIIYTTQTCVYCKMARALFQKQGLPYIEKDVGVDDNARSEMIEKSGQMGVPVIDIDGSIVVGFDRDNIMNLISGK